MNLSKIKIQNFSELLQKKKNQKTTTLEKTYCEAIFKLTDVSETEQYVQTK